MTTTYVRLKNRRGNKADLPTPLAEGELGFALDTRELYIGAGEQDSKNRMVQINNFLNAQNHTQADIDTQLVVFNLSGVSSYLSNGSATSPSLTKIASKTISASSDFVVTEYNLNNLPSIVPSTNYVQSNVGSTTFDFSFVSSAIPEANSVIVVSSWTLSEIIDSVKTAFADEHEAGNVSNVVSNVVATAGIYTIDNSANTAAVSANSVITNTVYVDLTTGTGFYDVGASGNTQSMTNLFANLDVVSSANTNTNLNILGSVSSLPYSSRSIEVEGDLQVEMDSPQQAVNLVTFLNDTNGANEATVANNIKIYTQDSKPEIENNTFVTYRGLLKATVNANANADILSFSSSDTNTVFMDYSLQFDTDKSVGTLKVISDGTSVSYVDDRTDITDTSALTIEPIIDGDNLVIRYDNSSGSATGVLYYTIKRWHTPD